MRLLATLLVILTNLAALPLMAQQEVDQTQTPRPVVSVIAARQSLPQPDFVGPVAARVAVDLGFPMIGTVAERRPGWATGWPRAMCWPGSIPKS